MDQLIIWSADIPMGKYVCIKDGEMQRYSSFEQQQPTCFYSEGSHQPSNAWGAQHSTVWQGLN